MLGQFATTGTLGYITVKHLGVMWMLANGHVFSNAETFLAYASKPAEALSSRARPAKASNGYLHCSACHAVFSHAGMRWRCHE